MARILLLNGMSRERSAPPLLASPVLHLAPGLRLLNQDDADRCELALDDSRHVLLNVFAARLLSCCDGTRSAAQIAGDYREQRDEVLAFLDGAIKSGWIHRVD